MFIIYILVQAILSVTALSLPYFQKHDGRGRDLAESCHGSQISMADGEHAGAFLGGLPGTISSVTATFLVPPVSETGLRSGEGEVGIDLVNCGTGAGLRGGVTFDIHDGFQALAQFFPHDDEFHPFEHFQIDSGDHITITVTAITTMKGMVLFQNENTGQFVSHELHAAHDQPLCLQEGEVLVKELDFHPNAPIIDLTFTGVSAKTSSSSLNFCHDAIDINFEVNTTIVASSKFRNDNIQISLLSVPPGFSSDTE